MVEGRDMSEIRFPLPDVGEGLTEAEIVQWRVAPGDRITLDQVFVEIETAKSLVELPSAFEGVVSELLVDEGNTVDVGTPILVIQTDAPGPDSRPPGGTGAPRSARRPPGCCGTAATRFRRAGHREAADPQARERPRRRSLPRRADRAHRRHHARRRDPRGEPG